MYFIDSVTTGGDGIGAAIVANAAIGVGILALYGPAYK
jgi:hypothetical protein